MNELEKLYNIFEREFSQLIGDDFGNLTSLTSIDLSFNQLELLNDDSFVNLINLESINLKKNYITELNWRLVKNLKHSKNFDISDNQLTKISTKIVGFLGKPIEKFSFVDNLCISMAYPNNNWQKIKENILERCLKPTPIYFEDEGTIISTINGTHKQGYSNNDVKLIEFKNLYLEFIPRNLFKIFPNIKSLITINSKLSQFIYGDLKDLHVIKIIENDLTILPNSFDGNYQLDFIDLSNNSIQLLPDNIFMSNEQIKIIKLSHNNITSLSSKIISLDNKISAFYFDNNSLKFADANILRKLKNAHLILLEMNVLMENMNMMRKIL
ncbi:hypothetical protein PVAND_000859 [Polypedilum vanderplanki]|uniref:Leucine rich repeat protein n=1 Tax=Polypedilum vanderplanki TaxID=319348 RepID=A0A9J6BLG4_POLVA|nr:hypothetical protein PVAND_000859 [Polypedilum vanderplanki]